MLTVFTDGQPADRSLLNSTLTSIQGQGAALLSTLSAAETGALADLNRGLSALNARRQRANTVLAAGVLARLDLSSFTSIDQANTTATVRIDALTATLRERNLPANPSITSNVFTADQGTVNTYGNLYQVYTADPTVTPTGTFTIQLESAVVASQIVVDIFASPSGPAATVQVSADGSTYTAATATAVEGYRITAQVPAMSVQYIQVVVSPTHPDTLDGSTFTFGITDISMSAVQFQLASELSSRPILITPGTPNFQFVADADPGVLFYLSVNGAAYFQVSSGSSVAVPGASPFANINTPNWSSTEGLLEIGFPSGMYPNSLAVFDLTAQQFLPVVEGLSPTDPNLSTLTQTYASLYNNQLYLLPSTPTLRARLMNVFYVQGPSSVTVQLRVLLNTADRTVSPVFRGATFQEI